MAQNRGKQFEGVIKDAFLKVPNVSIDRLHDQTTGFKGSQNICDFIVYREPYEYYIECKSVHGASLPFSNITDTQWKGLLEKSKIEGVVAGVIVWCIDKDITLFIPIQVLESEKVIFNKKSVRYDILFDIDGFMQENQYIRVLEIHGKKKRVFFDYDMEQFFEEVCVR